MFRSPKTGLAPGFRFHPTDEELVCYYLKRKISGKPLHVEAISEIDIYKSEPWDLPGQSRLKTRDLEWYFFCALDKKYMNGSRMNRATKKGYWKATGKDRPIRRGSRPVGMKKTLVFHTGRAPSGERTNWVMHEYRLEDTELGQAGAHLNMFVLCRIVQKSGFGPRNGERYGAPLDEEEWGDDDVLIPKVESGDDGDIDTSSDVGERGYLQMDDGDQIFQDNGDMKIIDVNRDPVELKMRHFERLMKIMEELREENRNLKISRQAIEEVLEDRISGCIRKIEDLKNDRDRLELLEDRISEVLRQIGDLKRDKDHIEWKLFEGTDKVLSKELVMK